MQLVRDFSVLYYLIWKNEHMSERLYPEKPMVGVGAVIFKNDEVLLIKRGNPPLAGEWSIPGGKLEENESIIEAVKREIKEECNVLVDIDDLIDMFEYIEKDEENRVKYHFIVFDFKAQYLKGKLNHLSDASAARWVKLNDIDKYKMKKDAKNMIMKALNM
ncbi:MAG: phosphohydrolase [Spirochaetes bacterium]|nr:MAG: phosphohydrolase [Spirochaetota bacterium]